MIRPNPRISVRILIIGTALPLLVPWGGCERSLGSESSDAGPGPDGGLGPDGGPGPDGSPWPDGGCAPQDAYDDPLVDCFACVPCEDLTPYRWTGDRCAYEPVCCACAGRDCNRRFRTHGECHHAYGHCPQAFIEVEYPSARLIWMMPGGVAGWGPALALDGFGDLRSWNQAAGSPDWEREDPDYVEGMGIESANELFGLLEAINMSGLPHEPQVYGECYPVFWLLLEDCPGCVPFRMDYWSALDLRPEFNAVYEWFDQRLCRPGPSSDYPQTLPSSYCLFFMNRALD